MGGTTLEKNIIKSFLANPMKKGCFKTVIPLNDNAFIKFSNFFPESFSIRSKPTRRTGENFNIILGKLLQNLTDSDLKELFRLKKELLKKKELDFKEFKRKHYDDPEYVFLDVEIDNLKREITRLKEIASFKTKYSANLKNLLDNFKDFTTSKLGKKYFIESNYNEKRYVYHSLESSKNNDYNLVIVSLDEVSLKELIRFYNFLFGLKINKYVESHHSRDINRLYLKIFFDYIHFSCDELTYGKHIININKARDKFRFGEFQETIHYLGLALEELLESIYESTFFEKAPICSIKELLVHFKKKCFENQKGAHSELDKYLDYRNKEYMSSPELKVNKEAYLFDRYVDKAVNESKDIRNRISHRNELPVSIIDALQMVVGVGMLFRWWEQRFSQNYLRKFDIEKPLDSETK